MIKTEPAVRPDPVSRGDDEALPGGLQRNARLALVAALIGFGLWTIGNFLPALAWASVLAIAIWPLYERAQRRWPPGRHNVLMPTLFTLAIGILFGLPFVVLAIQGAREVQDILALYHKATTSGIAVPDWVSHLPFGGQAVEHWWSDNLANPVEKNAILQRVNRASVLQIGQNVGRAVARRIVVFFFTLMTLFFLLKDGRGVVRDLLIASQRLFGARGERIARQMVSSVHGTVDGLVLVGLGEGVLMGIAYAVAGVPHPTLLGGLTALAAMVPFVVTFVFAGVGILLVVQGSVGAAIAIVAIGTVLVLVADHFIRPALIGGATRLPFLWVLFGILGGVETWGIVGLFVGPALMAALILLWREFTEAPSEQGTGLAQRA
jgi:predicted PurR-regulated permease PerM